MTEWIMVVKWLLLFHDCDISDAKFRNKVKLPRKIRRDKEPLDKENVRTILLAINDPSLKTYMLLLACTGIRATEAASVKIGDFDLKARPSTRQH